MAEPLFWGNILHMPFASGMDLEVRRDGLHTRGPIEAVNYYQSDQPQFWFSLSWTARFCPDTRRWRAWSYGGIHMFILKDWWVLEVTADHTKFCARGARNPKEFEGIIHHPGTSQLEPATVVGLPGDVEDRSQWYFPKLELTSDEWDQICGPGTDVPSEGTLRQAIWDVAELGGYLWPLNQAEIVTRYLEEAPGGLPAGLHHPLLVKIMEQVQPGITSRGWRP